MAIKNIFFVLFSSRQEVIALANWFHASPEHQLVHGVKSKLVKIHSKCAKIHFFHLLLNATTIRKQEQVKGVVKDERTSNEKSV